MGLFSPNRNYNPKPSGKPLKELKNRSRPPRKTPIKSRGPVRGSNWRSPSR